ncbi:superoxide dismutase [Candidatus Uhrbacteria bacterium]|nr:superoxide dismutase [Candidatus Uhrbacteria bacterium]
MFELPELAFEKDSFAPWTSAETFDYHHGKHHAGYVKKLNAALEDSDLAGYSLKEVIAASRGENNKIFNSAAQHFNHSFFWNCLSVDGGAPGPKLAEMIDRDFESLASFKEQFSALAATHFGSGWAWLIVENDKLVLRGYHDADTPADGDVTPLLTLDVWEHAYYIDHRNNRAGFIEGFWAHVNWGFVEEQLG